MTPEKRDIAVLLEQAVASTKGALALAKQYDQENCRDSDYVFSDETIVSGGYSRNGDRLESAIQQIEQVLERTKELS